MNKVVSIFRAILDRPSDLDSSLNLPPVPELPTYESSWQNILVPDLDGIRIRTTAGRMLLERCEALSINPVGSVYSPRTTECGINKSTTPVTPGKPYRVLAKYIGKSRNKSDVHFFQFQCDDGSIHLVNANDCEFLGNEVKAA